jgi:glucose-1-phosphate adenylyltransferase
MHRDPGFRTALNSELDPDRRSFDARRSLAMILAGGVGTRLNVLVRHRAKPAVPFGGHYRLIDFPLSNLMNSGLERVGILTQYLPYSLTDHIGNGHAWGLVGRLREVRILPPHQGTHGSDWYRGTADAIYRNLSYIHRHDPELVLVLSGDHIYQMDYARMIDVHLQSGADATIAVRRVPLEEAHLFGLVHVDGSGRITGFEEKPARPTSNLISMGIYCFTTSKLIKRLEQMKEEHCDDFGHHVFPDMLRRGDRLFACPEEGYWQDVGTIKSYFDSHMDLLDPEHPLDLRAWRVRSNMDESRVGDRPPAWVGPHASLRRSVVSRGCRVEGTVEDSVLSPGVVVEPGAVVRRSIILHDSRIGAGAQLDTVIVDKGCVIGRETTLGGIGSDCVNQLYPKHLDAGITLLGKGARIPGNSRLGRNVVVFPHADLAGGGAIEVESGETVGQPDGPG